jgi:cell wall-associated NlpC family hydrolase
VATLLGISIIGGTYAEAAIKHAPAKPVRAAAAMGLAVILVAPVIAKVPVAAAQNPQQAVVDLAMSAIGSDYRFGAEGPKVFDCSGLVYWVFKQAGELPRIGGSRMGAKSYMRWFMARGRFAKTEDGAQPGDLVVWKNGHHIGIYIGPNRVVSALNPRLGVRLTDLTIPDAPTQFLHVNWGANDGGGNGGGGNGGGNNPPPEPTPTPAPTDTPPDNGGGGNGASDGSTTSSSPAPAPQPTDAPVAEPTPKPPAPEPPTDPSVAVGQAISDSLVGTLPTVSRSNPKPTGTNGVAIATVNLRESTDPASRILGWVGSGGYVKIVGSAYSPQGNLYFQVTTASGATGWVYSRWVLNTQ